MGISWTHFLNNFALWTRNRRRTPIGWQKWVPYACNRLVKMDFIFLSKFGQSTRGPFFWPREVFEGVESHVMDLLRKSDFGLLNFSTIFMITCPTPILVQFSKVRIEKWTKIGCDPRDHKFWWEIEWTKKDFRSKSITWDWTPSNTSLSQKRDPAYKLLIYTVQSILTVRLKCGFISSAWNRKWLSWNDPWQTIGHHVWNIYLYTVFTFAASEYW